MDRQLMITNEKYRFITGRQYPKLVLIEVDVSKPGSIILRAPDMPEVTVDLPTEPGKIIETEVFRMKCQGTDLGSEVGKWIAKFLDKPHLTFHLIYHNYRSVRL